jgi:hypothetical protein
MGGRAERQYRNGPSRPGLSRKDLDEGRSEIVLEGVQTSPIEVRSSGDEMA